MLTLMRMGQKNNSCKTLTRYLTLYFSIFLFLFLYLIATMNYATKNRKTMRKKINTKNILTISHLLDDILFRYLSKAPCAPSTFAIVSSMFSSILPRENVHQRSSLHTHSMKSVLGISLYGIKCKDMLYKNFQKPSYLAEVDPTCVLRCKNGKSQNNISSYKCFANGHGQKAPKASPFQWYSFHVNKLFNGKYRDPNRY